MVEKSIISIHLRFRFVMKNILVGQKLTPNLCSRLPVSTESSNTYCHLRGNELMDEAGVYWYPLVMKIKETTVQVDRSEEIQQIAPSKNAPMIEDRRRKHALQDGPHDDGAALAGDSKKGRKNPEAKQADPEAKKADLKPKATAIALKDKPTAIVLKDKPRRPTKGAAAVDAEEMPEDAEINVDVDKDEVEATMSILRGLPSEAVAKVRRLVEKLAGKEG